MGHRKRCFAYRLVLCHLLDPSPTEVIQKNTRNQTAINVGYRQSLCLKPAPNNIDWHLCLRVLTHTPRYAHWLAEVLALCQIRIGAVI